MLLPNLFKSNKMIIFLLKKETKPNLVYNNLVKLLMRGNLWLKNMFQKAKMLPPING